MGKRTTPDERFAIVNGVKNCKNKNFVAKVFGRCFNTVAKWCKRAAHPGKESFKDKPRNSKKKINGKTEASIVALRATFSWGTKRIKQRMFNLPTYVHTSLKGISVNIVQGVTLSRTAINDVLKKHKLNGYKKKKEGWKFFRAKKPNELWQLDIKGPYTIRGKKYYFIICIDDYSRYIVMAEQLDHCPTIKEIGSLLTPHIKKHKPKKILTDNNPFKEEWDEWCKENLIEPLHAHPYYPQDKGKVERAIGNLSQEFIYHLKKFPEWLDGKIKEFQKWFNHKRFHSGINNIPAKLYFT